MTHYPLPSREDTMGASDRKHAGAAGLHAGLLLLRVGVGASFLLIHGGPKLLGGAPVWERVG